MANQMQRVRDQAQKARAGGKLQKARALFEQYLKAFPDDADANLALGDVFMQLELFNEAAGVYAKMLQKNPKQEVVLSNLGGALIRLGRAQEAKAILDYALEINPKNIYARINLGGVLQALDDHHGAFQNALEAVSVDPTNALSFNNLGSALSDLAKFAEAKHAFETAVMLDPKNIDAHINLANIESMLGAPQAAIAAHQKALSLLPTEAKQRAEAIRFYMSFEYLKQGMLPEGWDCYEGGFSNLVPVAGARHPRRQFAVPRWNGEILNGKTLLVWREQGLGDELLFATCLHELEALGGKVIVECDKRLVEPFARSFPQYTVRAEAFLPDQGMQSPYKDFDLHVPLGSLMKYFRRDIKDFERSGAYIKTDPAKVAKFEGRLAPYKEDYRLVGICWRSGKLDPVRNLGYTTLDEWGEVLQTPGFKFVNLQYGDCEAELQQAEEKYGVEILRWPDLNLKDDLDDVFALMHCLDAVASVQTAVLVMGGSVGVPTVGVKAGGWTSFGVRTSHAWLHSVKSNDELEGAAHNLTYSILKSYKVEVGAQTSNWHHKWINSSTTSRLSTDDIIKSLVSGNETLIKKVLLAEVAALAENQKTEPVLAEAILFSVEQIISGGNIEEINLILNQVPKAREVIYDRKPTFLQILFPEFAPRLSEEQIILKVKNKRISLGEKLRLLNLNKDTIDFGHCLGSLGKEAASPEMNPIVFRIINDFLTLGELREAESATEICSANGLLTTEQVLIIKAIICTIDASTYRRSQASIETNTSSELSIYIGASAHALFNLGDFQGALSLLNSPDFNGNSSPDFLRMMSLSQYLEGSTEEALSTLNKITQLDNTKGQDTLNALVYAARLRGDFHSCEKFLSSMTLICERSTFWGFVPAAILRDQTSAIRHIIAHYFGDAFYSNAAFMLRALTQEPLLEFRNRDFSTLSWVTRVSH